MDMSIMLMFMLHQNQQKFAEEIKVQEESSYDKMKQFRSIVTSLETESVELQQQKEQLCQEMQGLDNAINASCRSVPKETIFKEMVPEAKILQLWEIIIGFNKKMKS